MSWVTREESREAVQIAAIFGFCGGVVFAGLVALGGYVAGWLS